MGESTESQKEEVRGSKRPGVVGKEGESPSNRIRRSTFLMGSLSRSSFLVGLEECSPVVIYGFLRFARSFIVWWIN
jgi:hypothetical protein